MKLVEPTIKYKESFLKALSEYKAEEETDIHARNIHYKKLKKENLKKNFQSYVVRQLEKAKGMGLEKGYVPEFVYWLIDNNEYIGRVNIRNGETENLLKFGGHVGYDIRPSKRGKGYGKKIFKTSPKKSL